MTERGILFSAPMVRALLDGSKTQTRRPAKPRKKPSLLDGTWTDDYVLDPGNREWLMRDNPYGQPGDRLWVRETSAAWEAADGQDVVHYFADGAFHVIEDSQQAADQWLVMNTYRGKRGAMVPSIHMPRWASRILLEVVSVRVERLQDISEADAKAEGTSPEPYQCAPGYEACSRAYRGGYRKLWETINGAGSWDVNPWVWVVEFRRIER